MSSNTIDTDIDSVLRAYVVDGVPSSGINSVDKPTFRIVLKNMAMRGLFPNVTAATTIALAALTAKNITVVGTANVSSFGTTAVTDGQPFYIVWPAGCTITETANLLLPGAGPITTQAGDISMVVCLGGSPAVWLMIWHFRAAQGPDYPSALANPQLASAVRLVMKRNAVTPSTKIDVTAAGITLTNASNIGITLLNVAATLDLTTSGTPNGMDTGARPANGLVYVWAISNGSAFALLGSTSQTAPLMPAGYTYNMYLGAMRLTSSTLWNTVQNGGSTQYAEVASGNPSALPNIASGTTSGAYVAKDITGIVPPSASRVSVILFGAGNNAAVAPNANWNGLASTSGFVGTDSAATNAVSVSEFVIEGPLTTALYYLANTANARLWCLGWVDGLVNAT